MNRPSFALVGLSVLLCLSISLAVNAEQDADDIAIEKVVTSAMEATREMEWIEFAELMHPEALKGFKDMFVPVLEACADQDSNELSVLLPLFGAADLGSAVALDPKKFLANFMSGFTSVFPQAKDAFAGMDSKIVGIVYEDDDLAHVVSRVGAKVEDMSMTKMTVTTLKRSGAEWRMLLTGEMQGLGQQFRSALQKR